MHKKFAYDIFLFHLITAGYFMAVAGAFLSLAAFLLPGTRYRLDRSSGRLAEQQGHAVGLAYRLHLCAQFRVILAGRQRGG